RAPVSRARPPRAGPDRPAGAVLLERANPELRQLLVTAAELQGRRDAEGDPEARAALRARILAAAASPAERPDPPHPRLRVFLSSPAAVGCVAVLVWNPQATGVFFDRLFFGNTAWPQRTHLSIEIPIPNTGRAVLPVSGEPLEVRVARGTDVPVVVIADGAVPDEVTLHFSGGHKAVLSASGGPHFRT